MQAARGKAMTMDDWIKKFKVKQDREYISDFDREIKKLLSHKMPKTRDK